ncbi:MAG: carbamoyltransferase HypF [Desulfobacteraceae bacterium]
MTRIQARKLTISGVVQGVGFRPFLYQMAAQYGLKGEVVNTSKGVTLFVEGPFKPPLDITSFCDAVKNNSPPLAMIDDLNVEIVSPKGYEHFSIGESRKFDSGRFALISPDMSVCRDCINEMNDPENRRFEYPFINCTNCGPRYTIIRDIPYDRPKTAMSGFKMCPKCQQEYDDPEDRRFHAQPNACPVCGPHAFLVDRKGRRIAHGDSRSLVLAAEFLNQGKILAVKGLGGFHLAVDALNEKAVAELRKRKKRPDKPFALMAKSVAAIEDFVFVSRAEENLLTSQHRPVVLLEKKQELRALSPENRYLGVMLPYTPLHYLLFKKGPRLLVMTSGNRSGEPLSIDNEDALDAFSSIADYFLLHNRDICFRADDSIVQHILGHTRFLRRSRGYAPLPVFLDSVFPQILALGGGLKSTVCLTKENRAFLSQYIGDLDNLKVFDFYKRTISHLKRILDIKPDIIACDMHPGYMSTSYAQTCLKERGKSSESGADPVCIEVQHHHAHAVSCMAEHHLREAVIAVILDGTGLGTDKKIWGGEVLVCSEAEFTRQAHLAYVPMPGGEMAVKEPWRMAAAYLFKAFGPGFVNMDIPFIHRVGREKLNFLVQMMEKQLNSPLTSSCGRFFDAAASLVGIKDIITFESQAAMALEAAAQCQCEAEIQAGSPPDLSKPGNHQGKKGGDDFFSGSGYDFRLNKEMYNGGSPGEIDCSPVVVQIIDDVRAGEPVSRICRKFHLTVIDIFVQAADRVSRQTGIKKAVLSGGVFNNAIVLNGICLGLENKGMRVYTHEQVPCGDGGISLGQAVAAAAKVLNRTEQRF